MGVSVRIHTRITGGVIACVYLYKFVFDWTFNLLLWIDGCWVKGHRHKGEEGVVETIIIVVDVLPITK